MVYRNPGGARDDLGVPYTFVVGHHAKQVELKSRLVADLGWDLDCVTMFSCSICEINLKERP